MQESELLRHIFKSNTRLPADVTIPPGDDMAGVKWHDPTLLITVDQLADGVHFRLADTSLELIGRKAITRNLSDVAAMAAIPVAAVVAAALPRHFTAESVKCLFDAMQKVALQYQCPLVGGDITIYDAPLMLTVTVFASPQGIEPIRRSGAKPGDVIAVTGQLGKAWSRESSGGAHLTFEPRIALARKLACHPGVQLRSMIDISDGLATDLRHICEQSKVGAQIISHLIPLREQATVDNALCDGEDYELLLTVSAESEDHLPSQIDGVKITRIGQVLSGNDIWLVHENGHQTPLMAQGWEHVAHE